MEDIPGLKECEDNFNVLMTGKVVKHISLINVNPKYMAFDSDRIWVLDGGAHFTLEDGNQASYC